MPRCVSLLILIWLLVFSTCLPAFPSDLRVLADPRVGQLEYGLDFSLNYYPTSEVSDQSSELEVLENRLGAILPLFQSHTNQLALHLSVSRDDFTTDAVLPDSGLKIPDKLWDLRLGSTFKHRFDNGLIMGAGLSIGSAGQDPLEGTEDLYFLGTLTLLVPHSGRNYWIFGVNYSSSRTFLKHVPFPIVAYSYNPGRKWGVTFGLPFLNLWAKPLPDLTLRAGYYPVRSVRASVSYRLFPQVSLFGGFAWSESRHFLNDRVDDDDQLTRLEKKVHAGIRLDLAKAVALEFSGGYAFDRRFYHGQGLNDDDGFNIESGWFVGAMVALRYNPGGRGGKRPAGG
jgi:hypothetical protein